MNIISLLPFLCLNINDNETSVFVSKQLSKSCDFKNLTKISKVFLRYSKGIYNS
jgi:hypothetical protein